MNDRLFMSQEVLDEWSADSKIELEENALTIIELDRRFDLLPAVHFVADVGDGSDAYELIGRVKDEEQLAEMGAEHYMDSVLLGDSAYQVVQGFVGNHPELPEKTEEKAATADSVDAVSQPDTIEKAAADAPSSSDKSASEDEDLLTKFLLENM